MLEMKDGTMETRREAIAREIEDKRAQTERMCACLEDTRVKALLLIDASQCHGISLWVLGGVNPDFKAIKRCQHQIGHHGGCEYGETTGAEWARANKPHLAQYLQHVVDEIEHVWEGHTRWAIEQFDRYAS